MNVFRMWELRSRLTEWLHVFCSGPILGIFCLLLCSFPPFLQWVFFSPCFQLLCSGNNKADFYLYAQMLGRLNLVGLFYISLSLSCLFFCFPLCPPCLSMCHWTSIALFCTLQIEFIDHYYLIKYLHNNSDRQVEFNSYELIHLYKDVS